MEEFFIAKFQQNALWGNYNEYHTLKLNLIQTPNSPLGVSARVSVSVVSPSEEDSSVSSSVSYSVSVAAPGPRLLLVCVEALVSLSSASPVDNYRKS